MAMPTISPFPLALFSQSAALSAALVGMVEGGEMVVGGAGLDEVKVAAAALSGGMAYLQSRMYRWST
jgi:hypothetical protein